MGVLLSIMVFGSVAVVVGLLLLRYRRVLRQRRERRKRGGTRVVYEKKPEDGVEKKPLE